MKSRQLLIALSLILASTRATQAVDLLNATWVSSGSVTTSGSGSLAGSTISITTAAVANGGVTNGQNWSAIGFISTAGLTNITPAGGIDIAFNGNATTAQGLTFSGSGVTNPYLLFNFTEAGDTVDFGSNSFTLVASSNAQAVGNTITNTGATNTGNDGFVVRFNGTYTNLSYNVIRTGNADSLAMSVAVAVPEPSSYALAVISAIGVALVRKTRSRKA